MFVHISVSNMIHEIPAIDSIDRGYEAMKIINCTKGACFYRNKAQIERLCNQEYNKSEAYLFPKAFFNFILRQRSCRNHKSFGHLGCYEPANKINN